VMLVGVIVVFVVVLFAVGFWVAAAGDGTV
jgi:hypothetical protein